MNREQRIKFRKSRIWRRFKSEFRLKHTVDAITNEPLVNTWNLHHLDLSPIRYDDLSCEDHFVALNPSTHDLIHELFKLYKKDRKVIARIEKMLETMFKLTYKE